MAPSASASAGAIHGAQRRMNPIILPWGLSRLSAAGIIIRQDGAVAEAQIALELTDPQHGKDASAVAAPVELLLIPGFVPILDRGLRLQGGDAVIRINPDDAATTDAAEPGGDEAEALGQLHEVTPIGGGCDRCYLTTAQSAAVAPSAAANGRSVLP